MYKCSLQFVFSHLVDEPRNNRESIPFHIIQTNRPTNSKWNLLLTFNGSITF